MPNPDQHLIMSSAFLAAIAAFSVWYFGKIFLSFRRNIALAKVSGFKYVVTREQPCPLQAHFSTYLARPRSLLTGLAIFAYQPVWMMTHAFWTSLIKKYVPGLAWEDWLYFTDTDWTYNHLNAPFERLGTDAILLVSSQPNGNSLFVNDASLIHQITSSREKFSKKTSDYRVLNAFGRNIVTTEGAEWRRHRKAMAPGFNESNNRLVFHETIMQCEGMIGHWMTGGKTGEEGEYISSKPIESLPDDTMRITLHIITAIGFGVRLLWPGVKAKGERDDSGLITYPDEPQNGHTMAFQASIKEVLEKIFLLLIFPMWGLSRSSRFPVVPSRRASHGPGGVANGFPKCRC